MPLTNLTAATRARNYLTERSPAEVKITIPHIVAMVPTALEAWSRLIMGDRDKRRYLLTTFTTDEFYTGGLDMAKWIDGTSGKISLDDFRSATLYMTADTGDRDAIAHTPVIWVNSRSQLGQVRLVQSGPSAYLEGTTLLLRAADGTINFDADQFLNFTVFDQPEDVTEIPLPLEQDFVVFLADMAKQEKALG
jgi:hypothetical protein